MEKPKGFDDIQNDSYSDYINSSEWQLKRSARLKMDNYQCQKCGSTRSLQVHHINYERFKNENIATDLITLCKSCHEAIEQNKKSEDDKKNKEREEEQKRIHEAYIQRQKQYEEMIAAERELKKFLKYAANEFIASCEINNMDYYAGGDYNLCDYKIIKILFYEFLEQYNFPKDKLWMVPLSSIQIYFRNKRYRLIRELRMKGWPDYAIQKEYHFSQKMMQKPDKIVDLFLKEEECNNAETEQF